LAAAAVAVLAGFSAQEVKAVLEEEAEEQARAADPISAAMADSEEAVPEALSLELEAWAEAQDPVIVSLDSSAAVERVLAGVFS
jgi:hypothetical protein